MMMVTYGEALVDLIEQPDGSFAAMPGGSVWNFTLALARQGLPATYLNPLSVDSFGARFVARMNQAGVLPGTPRRSTLPTALALVTQDASGTPAYAFHRAQVADRDITLAQAVAALPPAITLFHSGGLALVPDDLATTLGVIAAAGAAGALVSIDANLRPLVAAEPALYAAGVRRTLAQAHLIKVSEEDLRYLDLAPAAPLAAARTLFDNSAVQLVALTLGPAGAVLLTRTTQCALPAPSGLAIVDTVGAGDCFHAGLVASLHQAGALTPGALARLDGARLTRALRYAIAAASLNVMRQGCNPPLRVEVEQFLASQAGA